MDIGLQNFDIVQQLTMSPHNPQYLGFLKRDSTRQLYLIQLIEIPSAYNINNLRQKTKKLTQLQHQFLLKKVWVSAETLNDTENLVLISRAYSEWYTLKQLGDSYKKLSRMKVLEVILKLVDLVECLHSQGMYLGSISLHQVYLLGRNPLLNYIYLPQLSKKSLLIERNGLMEDVWIAPETLQEGRVDQRSDIWCLGALLSYMLKDKPLNEFYQLKMVPPQNNLAYIRQWNLRSLLEMMLQAQPLDRPSLSEVKQILRGILINPSFDPRQVMSELEKREEPSIIPLRNIKVGCFIGKYEILKILRSEKGKISCLTFEKEREEEKILKMMEVPEVWLQICLLQLNAYSILKHQNLIVIEQIISHEILGDPKLGLIAMILEYCPEGTVADTLQGMAWKKIEEIKDICHQIGKALIYLHFEEIIHQNFSIDSIYMKKGKFMLGERATSFELDQRSKQYQYTKSNNIPLEYPPEAIVEEASFSSDVWSLGALFLRMHLNQFINQNNSLCYQKNEPNIERYIDKIKLDKDYENFLRKALLKDTKQRILISELTTILYKNSHSAKRKEKQKSRLEQEQKQVQQMHKIKKDSSQNKQEANKLQRQFIYDSEEDEYHPTDEAREQSGQYDGFTKIFGEVVYPYICIGRIFSKFLECSKSGNGFLISDRLVVTCAHNIYSRKQKMKANQILFIHAKEGNIKILEYRYPRKFMGRNNYCKFFDYCILLLEKPVKLDKYLDVAFGYDEISEAEIAGYVQQQKQECYSLHGAKDRIKKMKGGIIRYIIPTTKGLSGSPVLVQTFDGFYYAVGIHFAGGSSQKKIINYGVHFNKEVAEEILSWTKMSKKSQPVIFINYSNLKLWKPQQPRDDYVPSSEKIKSLQIMLGREEQENKQSLKEMDLNIRIGHQLKQNGNYRQAIVHHQRALSISRKYPIRENIARCYCNIGLCYFYLKQHQNSLKYSFQALSIFRDVYGENHRFAARIYLNIGIAKNELGQSSQAVNYYQQAISIIKQDNDEATLAYVLNNMAVIQVKDKRYEEACINYKEVLGIQEKLFGIVNFQSLDVLHNLSKCYFLMNRRMEGWQCYYKCLINIEILKIPKQHPVYHRVFNNLIYYTDVTIRHPEYLHPTKEELLLVQKIIVRLRCNDQLIMRVRQFLRDMK